LNEEFSRFRNDGGEALAQWSLFEAFKTKFDGRAWFDWPAPFRDRHSAEVAAFARDHDDELGFYDFLQWQASKQLGAASTRCRELGMTVGLYHDLALGVVRDGAEAWANPSLFVGDVSIGAPPDLYNSRGQDWGLVPMNPAVLRSLAYQPFVAMLRTAMRHGGALRIDHVMMLQRLFWIPQGLEPGDGAYLRQPLEDLIGVLALESQRNRCIVVGEDLGTVAAGFRERMSEAGVLSYRLLYFQHDKKLRYLPPRDYPKLSMVTVGTHDLPTLPAFWSGADIALRQKLGHIDARGARLALTEREEQRHNLAAILQQCGLLLGAAANGHLTQDLALAIHAFLARTPGRLVMARFDDLLDVIEQANVPGTSTEHPNWRSKLPLSTEALAIDPRIVRLARLLRRLRPPRKN
jgi:4-alpha-glucanotransferase